MGEVVTLGRHVLPVVPQKHAYLRHNLSAEDFQAIFSKDYGHESYRVLCVLIPALRDVPEWEFEGFGSQEAWETDQYEETLDHGPTTSQMVDAFEKALMVSGADRLGKIIELIQMGQKAIPNQQAKKISAEQMPTPLGSLGVNGESPSGDIGTSPPTTTEKTA